MTSSGGASSGVFYSPSRNKALVDIGNQVGGLNWFLTCACQRLQGGLFFAEALLNSRLFLVLRGMHSPAGSHPSIGRDRGGSAQLPEGEAVFLFWDSGIWFRRQRRP